METKVRSSWWLGVALSLGLWAGVEAGEWQSLIEREGLGKWQQRGGVAKYRLEGDVIVGESVADTPNSFLCTQAEYGDFELEYEFRVDGELNSGVQIRSQAFAEAVVVEVEGKKYTIPAKRVHGYQVEIDCDGKKGEWRTAGVYEEAVRGWLYPGLRGGQAAEFREQGKRLSRPGEWNRVRVVATGKRIQTYLNGELRADFEDARVAKGFIGLQVHAVGKNPRLVGKTVSWRNLRIRTTD